MEESDLTIDKLYGGVPSFRIDHPWFGVLVDTEYNYPLTSGVYLGNGWFITSNYPLQDLFDKGLPESVYFDRFRVRFGITSAQETPETNIRVREYSINRNVKHPDFKFWDRINGNPEAKTDFYYNNNTFQLGYAIYQFSRNINSGQFATADLLLIKVNGNPDSDGVIPLGLPNHQNILWNTNDNHQLIGIGDDYIFINRYNSKDFISNTSDIESNTQIQLDIDEQNIVKKTPVHLTTSDGYKNLNILSDTWQKIYRNLVGETLDNFILGIIDINQSSFTPLTQSQLEDYSEEWFKATGIWTTSDKSGASSFRIIRNENYITDFYQGSQSSNSHYSVVADHGAPLVATSSDGREYLAGVFSWSRFFSAEFPYQMGEHYPDVITSVKYYMNWIESVISSDMDFNQKVSYTVELDEIQQEHKDPVIFDSQLETNEEYLARLEEEFSNLTNSLTNYSLILNDLELDDVLMNDSDFQQLISNTSDYSSKLENWISNLENENTDYYTSDHEEYIISNNQWTSDRNKLELLVNSLNQNSLKLEPAITNGDIDKFIADSYLGDLRYLKLYKSLNTRSLDLYWYQTKGTVYYSELYNYYTIRSNSKDNESILQSRYINHLNRYEAVIRSAHLITNYKSVIEKADTIPLSYSRVGLFNENWGYFFQFNTPNDESDILISLIERYNGVDYETKRENWNIDTFDGNGRSTIKLEKLSTDPRGELDFKLNCFPKSPLDYWFRYEPSGFVFVGFRIGGLIKVAHIYAQRTRILNNLPLRIEVNTDTVVNEFESRLYDYEIYSISEFDRTDLSTRLNWRNLSLSNIRTGVKMLSSAGETIPINNPIISFKAPTPANGMPPVSFQITEIQMIAYSQVPKDNPEIPFNPNKMELYWELVLNARLPSATWYMKSPLNSQLVLDSSSEQLAEGTVVASGMAIGLEVIKPDVFITGTNLDAISDTLTLAVRGIRSGLTSQSSINSRNLDLWYLIKWREF